MADLNVQTFEVTHGTKDLADIELCKKIYGELERSYPGHRWCVGANSQTGVFDIKLLYLDRIRSFGDFGWLGHLRGLENDTAMSKIRNAGGELLERYGLPRREYREGDMEKARENGLDLANSVGKSRGSTI